MKIATFNINGIKARQAALTDWLTEAAPDVALLQEIKSVDDAFPRAVFEDMGYNVETHGQKSFNGVAILSKRPLEDVTRGLHPCRLLRLRLSLRQGAGMLRALQGPARGRPAGSRLR